MPDALILFDVAGSVATVTLNRPAKLNALTLEMLNDLSSVCEALDNRADIRVVLLTGAGARAFCAGADIFAWSELTPTAMWRTWVRRGHQLMEVFAGLRQPTIAVIDGMAYGGGLELALSADLRLASERALFAMPEVTVGTVPGWGGSQRLPGLIGQARAKQMIFTGKPVDAATAEKWGLVNEVVPSESLKARAHDLALSIAQNSPSTVQVAKQLVQSGDGIYVSRTVEALAGAFVATTEDGAAQLASFKERRKS